MRADGSIELTSNITEDTVFDEPEPVLSEEVLPGRKVKFGDVMEDNEKTPEQRMEDAIMGFQGGVGWQDEDSPLGPYNTEPLDDPLTELSIRKAVKM